MPNTASGTVTIPKVNTHYPFPLPDGSYVAQGINVGYEINSANMKLKNVPELGNYYFWLHVIATDPMGQVAETTVQGHFEGDAVKLEGGYEKDLADCLDLLNAKLQVLSFAAHKPEIKSPPIPDHPGPDHVVKFVNTLLDSGVPEADETLAHVRLLLGQSFHKDIGSARPAEERDALERGSEGKPVGSTKRSGWLASPALLAATPLEWWSSAVAPRLGAFYGWLLICDLCIGTDLAEGGVRYIVDRSGVTSCTRLRHEP